MVTWHMANMVLTRVLVSVFVDLCLCLGTRSCEPLLGAVHRDDSLSGGFGDSPDIYTWQSALVSPAVSDCLLIVSTPSPALFND